MLSKRKYTLFGCSQRHLPKIKRFFEKKNIYKLIKLKDEHKNKILNEKLDFLKSFSMFSKWSTNNLKTLLNFCEIRVYQYSSIIFKEKELANYLYLIKNGEIEVSFLFSLLK